MGLFTFLKEAGQKLFGKEVKAEQAAADPAKRAEADRAAATAIENYVQTLGLKVTAFTVTFDGVTAIAKVYGVADDQENKEKAIPRSATSRVWPASMTR